MRIMREIALLSGKIYTAGTNFTRLSVATVATNPNSVNDILTQYGSKKSSIKKPDYFEFDSPEKRSLRSSGNEGVIPSSCDIPFWIQKLVNCMQTANIQTKL